MALDKNFYSEIYEKETMWIDMLKSNLMNVYYLPEIKKFYIEKQAVLDYEFQLTRNDIMRSISFALNNIIVKIDDFIKEDKKGTVIILEDLIDLFLINIFNKNMPIINKSDINITQQNKKSLYELRKKITDQNNEDYIDDDFYYNKKVA